MPSRAPQALACVVVLVGLAAAGCVGQDTPQDVGEANTADPGTDVPEDRDGGDGGPDSGPDTGRNRTEAANDPLPVDLVWATDREVVRWDPGTDDVTRIPVEDGVGQYNQITAIAQGPDGSFYATTSAASPDPLGIGSNVGGSPSVVRIDLSAEEVETVHSGPPLSTPLALTVLDDGRVLVADRGEVAWLPQGAPGPSGRIVEVMPDGTAGVLTSDPRFDDWMDIHATGGDVYLATQTDQELTSPTAPGGTGAIWRVDAASGSHELVSSSSIFQEPSGLTADGDGGLYVSEWTGARMLQVDPSSGEATVVSEVNGSANLWGADTLPDGRIVAADAGGIWIVDPASGDHRRLFVAEEGEPRHVHVLEDA